MRRIRRGVTTEMSKENPTSPSVRWMQAACLGSMEPLSSFFLVDNHLVRFHDRYTDNLLFQGVE